MMEAENVERNIIISNIQKIGSKKDDAELCDVQKAKGKRRDQVERKTINSSSNIIIVKFK